MIKSGTDFDSVFRRLEVENISSSLNSYLGSNYPTDEHRLFIKTLNDKYPEFRLKAIVFRAVKKKRLPVTLRNKYVSGCLTVDDVINFINKRKDKGYKYILESKEPIEYFDLYSFIDFFNKKYGSCITERYQDEKEVLFILKSGNKWFCLKKYENT